MSSSRRPSSFLVTRERLVRSWTRWRRSRMQKRLARAETALELQAQRVARLELRLLLAGQTERAQLALVEQMLRPPAPPTPDPPTQQEARRVPPAPHFPPPMPPEETPPPAEDQLRDLLQQT